MSNCLYLECFSGISGDMTAAALLDLGADREVLRRALDSLPVDGFTVKISRVVKAGLDVCDFDVCLDAQHENHDHDMGYLYGGIREPESGAADGESADGESAGGKSVDGESVDGESAERAEHGGFRHVHEVEDDHDHVHGHDHQHDHDHAHGHDHQHDHDHVHGHDHPHDHEHAHGHDHLHDHEHAHDHTHTHDHRSLPDILHIISHADMTPGAKDIAIRIFRVLAEAEAKAHGVPADQVHFHEVGAVDSIVDIVTAAVCLDDLGITETIVSPLSEGSGFVRCQHGVIPVPVPAVLNIVQASGLRLHMTQMQGELVTPTGAAIAAAIRTSDSLPESFRIIRTGLGAGKRKYERPSILRAMLIEGTESGPVQNSPEQTGADRICKLESNIDDCTGEVLGYVMEQLFAAGARDVHYMPVYMKKNRPAYQLNVICTEELRPALEEIIFRETTTIGIRRVYMERTVMQRECQEVETPFGSARVKVCTWNGITRCYPEYESVAGLAQRSGRTFQEIYSLLLRV